MRRAGDSTTFDDHIPIHDEFVYCLGAATEVLKFGPWRDLKKTTDGFPPDVLFLIIPGNPGVVGFYKTFMQSLYCGYKKRYPVWAISHAGHCSPPLGMDMSDGEVLKSILLFPTIERMAQSPQGKIMTPILCSLRYIVYMPLYLLSFLPEVMKASLVKFALRGIKSVDESSLTASLDLFRVECSVNAMYMGSQEMLKVLERDDVTIKNNLNKLIFYYGASDHWCPVQYYKDLKKDFPDGDIWLCSRGIRHAFVLDSSKEVASIIIDMLGKVL
uniref:Lipid droplet-associated hydrolase n=1 Tax=Pyxicephalus adspersus TaxID=30357 RepID=A0AAV3A8V8_PYXAD|nr:TPA: hypothetical protein GDO54_010086 [Pyxicephalus adspersus]